MVQAPRDTGSTAPVKIPQPGVSKEALHANQIARVPDGVDNYAADFIVLPSVCALGWAGRSPAGTTPDRPGFVLLAEMMGGKQLAAGRSGCPNNWEGGRGNDLGDAHKLNHDSY